MKNVKFLYGDGFTGRNYRLVVGEEYYSLIDHAGGSPDDEALARKMALEILQRNYKNIPIENLPTSAAWDGTL